MKKIVSLTLVVLMIVAAFATCFAASAEETVGQDPTYFAWESMLTRTSAFYCNHLENGSKMFDQNYGGLIDYGGKTVVFSSGVSDEATEVTFINKGLWGSASTSQWGIDNQPVNINGVASEDATFVTIQGACNLFKSTLKSFIITVPANEELNDSLFEGFTIFAGDQEWAERVNYSTPLTTANNKTYTQVSKVDNIEWKLSADGTFKYYEADFDTPTNAEYIVIAFTADNFKHATEAFNEGKLAHKVLFPISEFAAFDKTLAEASLTTEAPATTKAPDTTKAPETTEAPATTAAPATTTSAPATEKAEEKGCGSVAAIGVAVMVSILGVAVIRKKH